MGGADGGLGPSAGLWGSCTYRSRAGGAEGCGGGDADGPLSASMSDTASYPAGMPSIPCCNGQYTVSKKNKCHDW